MGKGSGHLWLFLSATIPNDLTDLDKNYLRRGGGGKTEK
jgi:hypothetical protein